MNNSAFLAAAQANRIAHAVYGVVSAVDPVNHAMKVRIQPENIETGWMPDIGGVQAGDLRIACPSSVGTHVVLLPIEGDAEQFVAVGALFDTIVEPPKNPDNNKAIQPGEWLIKAGCGVPEGGARTVSQNSKGGWCFISSQETSLGIGTTKININNDSIDFSVDGVVVSISSSGLSVRGGDVQTERVSLNKHVHLVGNQKTTSPLP